MINLTDLTTLRRLCLPRRFTDEDVGDGRSLDRAVPGEGVAWWLTDHVVRVPHISGVVQLGDGYVYPGTLGYWLQHNIEESERSECGDKSGLTT